MKNLSKIHVLSLFLFLAILVSATMIFINNGSKKESFTLETKHIKENLISTTNKQKQEDNQKAVEWCLEKGILLKQEFEQYPKIYATRADMLRFILKYNSYLKNENFDLNANNDILGYIDYFYEKIKTSEEINIYRKYFEERKVSFAITSIQFIEILEQAFPDLNLEMKSNYDKLGTFNTQDKLGQYALKLCNAGIFEESERDYHWYKALTREEFASIVDRFYNSEKRKVFILKDIEIKELDIYKDEFQIKYIIDNYAVIENTTEFGLFDLKKNKIVFQGEGEYLKALSDDMFIFYSEPYSSIINSNGEVVLYEEVEFVTNYGKGFCVVVYPDNSYLHLIDKKGNLIHKINFSFDEIDKEKEIINTGNYLVTNTILDENLKLFNYETGKWQKTSYNYIFTYGDGRIVTVDDEKDTLDILNEDLSKFVQTNARYVFLLSDGYYAANIDLSDSSTIDIIDNSGKIILSHTVTDFDDMYFNMMDEGILFKDEYNIEDYPSQYTNINLNTLTKETMEIGDYIKSRDQTDVYGRRLYPVGSEVFYTTKTYMHKAPVGWVYEYENHYYFINRKR